MIIYKYKSLNFVLRLANNTSLPNCSFNVQWTFCVLKICVCMNPESEQKVCCTDIDNIIVISLKHHSLKCFRKNCKNTWGVSNPES